MKEQLQLILSQQSCSGEEAALQQFFLRLYKGHIRIDCDFDEEIPIIQVDPNQIKQAVLNLFLNAIEAMPKGGELKVKVKDAGSKSPDGGRNCHSGLHGNTGISGDPGILASLKIGMTNSGIKHLEMLLFLSPTLAKGFLKKIRHTYLILSLVERIRVRG